ncbi:hypothetical protein Bcav_0356 [Beutenbergia cavernae DSM 12333]|uniref:Uncharacterized protein n=1 Tax=Beutenbergia cavernae (strain ATCC BAA-8 / DSM 12333 / CCUG 43141 / JCM 11478 / NBRC 16432 / NCIMB 13614 / HKI 0122) TaxID=471853 RepID=C5BWG2_BEUC1|nr:hypothetical protein [Beutenbergia cavernae]ACQ78620.1 hypothetical protein Bcav_0356 [Beutenbergia cavernae DSM 12333]
MTTTRILTTALPVTLAAGAPAHLSVFVTHRLTPQAVGSTLADFPAAADWVTTLAGLRVEILASHLADPLPATIVSDPDAAAWRAVFPPGLRVDGFPEPQVSAAEWNSYPAHRLADHAVDLQLTSALAAPTARPGVMDSPPAAAVIDQLVQVHPAVRNLLALAEQKSVRSRRLLERRLLEARASLGTLGSREGYPSETDERTPSAIEVLLDERGAVDEKKLNAYLDGLLDDDLSSQPVLQLMADAHATRRYYDRPEEQTPYQREPTPGATTPRPEEPDPDFHARAAGLGSTPALLRRLGLVLDVTLSDADRAALEGASWIAARLVPADDDGEAPDVVSLAPPRLRVIVGGDVVAAISSDAWVAGAVPLGEEEYVVLDLDPDASGLKLDQHLRNLPRSLASEVNGDEASAAPATLRATGFGIARTDRVAATRERVQAAEQLTSPDDGPGVSGPELIYDDVVRGLRLEVWDDASEDWHSVHERLVDVTATGDDDVPVDVLTGTADTGFLQLSGLNRVPGNDANPYYLHEVVAGWDGWSLAAPRPGKVIVHGPGGEEQVVDDPRDAHGDAAVSGVHIRSTVAPGTLPRLRYGTSYAFRLVGVDLAGNSVVRTPRPRRPDLAATRTHLDGLRASYARRDGGGLVSVIRDDVLASLPRDADDDAAWLGGVTPGDDGGARRSRTGRRGRRGATGGASSARPYTLPRAVRTGEPRIDAFVAQRVADAVRGADPASRAAGGAGGAAGLPPGVAPTVAGLHRSVAAASRRIAEHAEVWRTRPQLGIDPEALAGLGDVLRRPGLPIPGRPLPRPRPVVTTPRPYLRWEPVGAPALVARAPLTTGEQLSRLVVRTGLPPSSPDAAATSERHVVPPKTHQLEAETSSAFDAAIGSTDPAVQRAAYGWALVERGTLTDRFVPDPANPGAELEQPDIALHARPDADPDTAVTLADLEGAGRGTPLGEGQYVVHDVDELRLPYLPDVFAAGVALVFYDAGDPHLLPDARVLQAVVIPFPGTWPTVEPLRLVLAGGGELGARLEGRAIHVSLPPGEQVRVAVSSSLRTDDLEKLGLWRSHPVSGIDRSSAEPAVLAAADLLRQAAVSGWTWWLTPSVDVRLVHAIPTPARPPELRVLRCGARTPGITVAPLVGLVDVHGASTDRLLVKARWTEQVDDVAIAAPAEVARDDVVVNSPVGGAERLGVLSTVDWAPDPADDELGPLAAAGVQLHRAIHTFTDTHHRRVTYTPTGTTRYREFFAAADVPADDDPALAGESVELVIPSTARPAAAHLAGAVPLLRWETTTEPDQPFALRRVRRSGVRIWLRRPWFSSGDGELLGVLLGTEKNPSGVVSAWGRDPVLAGAQVPGMSRPPLLTGEQLLLAAYGSSPGGPDVARPLTVAPAVPLPGEDAGPAVTVCGYVPVFHPGRGQWYVDVALDATSTLWPFVRLAVARYQPHSIARCELSAVDLVEWIQPLPTRTATVSRPDADRVRLTLTGVIALLRGLERGDDDEREEPEESVSAIDALVRRTRTVRLTLQARATGGTDLQWVDVASRRLPLVGIGDETNFLATWSGELALPAPDERPDGVPFDVALRTPGASEHWRVLVEEHELLDADAPDSPNVRGATTRVTRLVYADTIAL